jgi:DNA-binding NarL/FixJ family response regulator
MKIEQLHFLIINEHFIVNAGLKLYLKRFFKKSIISFSDDYEESLEIIQSNSIDVLIINNTLRGKDNLPLINKLKKYSPATKIIVFSLIEDDLYGAKYIQNGANAYLNKYFNQNTLKKIIADVVQNNFSYESLTEKKTRKKHTPRRWSIDSVNKLSSREYQIASMLIKGFKNINIAKQLNIGVTTVSTFKRRIFEKLKIDNILQLSEKFNTETIKQEKSIV